MGRLFDRLQKQLSTEHRNDAIDCLKIYKYLHESKGHVWTSDWQILVITKFKGFPSDERTFKPSLIGCTLIRGLSANSRKEKMYLLAKSILTRYGAEAMIQYNKEGYNDPLYKQYCTYKAMARRILQSI